MTSTSVLQDSRKISLELLRQRSESYMNLQRSGRLSRLSSEFYLRDPDSVRAYLERTKGYVPLDHHLDELENRTGLSRQSIYIVLRCYFGLNDDAVRYAGRINQKNSCVMLVVDDPRRLAMMIRKRSNLGNLNKLIEKSTRRLEQVVSEEPKPKNPFGKWKLDGVTPLYLWNYINSLGVDRETAIDLFQEAESAIFEAVRDRATSDNIAYFVKTGTGAIKHWLRDKYPLIRIPSYLHDRGEAKEHSKTIVPLDEIVGVGDGGFEEGLLDRLCNGDKRRAILEAARNGILTRAEREVIIGLLEGKTVSEIARAKGVRVGCVYAQKSKAITKLRKHFSNNA